jgi:PAS domain S-box-containing protein
MRPRRLSEQIVLPLMLVVGGVASALFFREYVVTRHDLREGLDLEAAELADHTERTARTLIARGDHESLSPIIEHFATDEEVCGIFLIDRGGVITASSDPSIVGACLGSDVRLPLQAPISESTESELAAGVNFKSVRNEAKVAYAFPFDAAASRPYQHVQASKDSAPETTPAERIIVVLDEEPMHAEIAAAAQRYIISSILMMVFVGAACWTVLHLMALRPLSKLVAAIVDVGEDSARFRIAGRLPRNELSDLGDRLAALFKRLDRSRAANARLALVAARTRSLIAISNARGSIVWCNDAFASTFDLPTGELDAQSHDEAVSLWRVLGIDSPADVTDTCDGEPIVIDITTTDGDKRKLRVECRYLGNATRDDDAYDDAPNAAASRAESDKACHGFMVVAADITEQHAAEERLELALRSANQGLWDWNLANNAVVFNDIWYTMLGYSPGELPMELGTWERLTHPEDLKKCYEAIGEHLAGNTAVYTCEHRMRCKDGSWRWILDVGEVTERDRDGTPIRLVGLHIDIHDQHCARDELQVSEHLFRSLFELSPLGIALNDRETGDFLDANKALLDATGYTADQLAAKSCWDITPPEYEPQRAEQLRSLDEFGKYGPFEKEYIRKDGTRFPVMLHGINVVGADGRERIWSFIDDISERRAAEAALRERTALLSGLLDSMPDIIFFKDLDGRYLGCNPEFARFVGQPRERIVGRSDFDIFPQHVATEFRRYDTAMLDGLTPQLNEEWVDHPESGRILLATLKAPLIDPRGELIGLLGVSRDITEREIARMRLDAARDDAERANRSKSAFLANMSHEIRTPMTAILGFAELLDATDIDRDERAEHVRTIKRNGQHLLTVINDILDVSKIEAGRLEIEAVQTDLPQLLAEVVELLRFRAGEKGLKLRLETDTRHHQGHIPATIRTDPVRLRQVLLNLLGNAIKFTHRGDIILRVALTEAEIADDSGTPTSERDDPTSVNARRDEDGDDMVWNGAMLRFDVIDTGMGMTTEQLERLFTPFSQADVSMTRRFGGTGLGLTISKSLIELLGGRIDVSSTPGEGSTFSVRLPIDDAACDSLVDPLVAAAPGTPDDPATVAPTPSASTSESSTEPLTGVRILLAEDGVDNQRLLSFHLRRAGATVHLAPNGAEAVRTVLDDPPAEAEAGRAGSGVFDLVLMDMQMPEIDGYEATRRLRAAGVRTPIIALTAHAMADDRTRCLDAGCDDFQTKPIDRDVLIDACRRWFSRDHARAA